MHVTAIQFSRFCQQFTGAPMVQFEDYTDWYQDTLDTLRIVSKHHGIPTFELALAGNLKPDFVLYGSQ